VCPVVKDANWASIEAEYFGSKVNSNGIPHSNNYTYGDLGTLCGIWGSAACLNINELSSYTVSSAGVTANIARGLIYAYFWARGKEFLANPFPVNSWCANEIDKTIFLRDAGFSFNIPIPPLLTKEREVDIIIVLDASEKESVEGEELIIASKWAKHTYGASSPFPSEETIKQKIREAKATGNQATISNQDESVARVMLLKPALEGAPAIVYIPVNNCGSHMPTLAFYHNRVNQDWMKQRVAKLWASAKKVIEDYIGEVKTFKHPRQ